MRMKNRQHKKFRLILPVFAIIFGVIIAVAFFLTKPNQISVLTMKDTKAPTISLKGEAKVQINLFDGYTDTGVTALDNSDGDISSKVVTINDINTRRIGKYKVTYSVIDKAGNKAQLQREIEVLPPAINNTVGIPILMYHFFYDSSLGQTPDDGNFIEKNVFDQHIKYLADNNFYFPTWTELEQYIDGALNLPQKSVIITVDDGSSTFFDIGYPILKKYSVPATSFLITSWSGNPDNFNVDRNIISFQSHSHDMHQGGCDGGHGGLMQCIDYQSGVDDLNQSKEILGSSDAFCYPFGDVNESAKQLLRDTGYNLAVTTAGGLAQVGSDKLELPRVRIFTSTDLDTFISLMQ